MTERENLGDIWLAAFFGSLFAVTAIVGFVYIAYGILLDAFPSALLALVVGVALAQISVVPLASAFGWMLTRRGEASWFKATLAGALAALLPTFALTAHTLFDRPEPGTAFSVAVILLVMTAIGSVSGLVGYWAVFWRARRSDEAS